MKLVTYVERTANFDPKAEIYKPRQMAGLGGVLVGDQVYNLQDFCNWARQSKNVLLETYPANLLDFVSLLPAQRHALSAAAPDLPTAGLKSIALTDVRLRAPIEVPPSVRDFYAFEQHVKTARANRGQAMIPEWYQFPVFYFTNHHAIYGPEDLIPYPRQSQALDIELEIAFVIGRAGRDIQAAEVPDGDYIAGFMVMNDWSARDLQMQELKLFMGPAKGKDFATSNGPYLVTLDEVADKRVGEGVEQRYDLTMTARLNGHEISRGNAQDIYFSFGRLIERASLNVWLQPGEVFGSGTVGTGCLLELGDKRERWLQPGDVLELEIERLGVLRNTVVAAE